MRNKKKERGTRTDLLYLRKNNSRRKSRIHKDQERDGDLPA